MQSDVNQGLHSINVLQPYSDIEYFSLKNRGHFFQFYRGYNEYF